MIDLSVQILILLYSFISGIIFGIGFDVYRILFRGSCNRILSITRDFVYWTTIGIFVFFFLLYTQYAVLSIYTYFYIFLGILFYIKGISRFTFNFFKNIIYIIFSFLKYIFKNILYIFTKNMGKKNY